MIRRCSILAIVFSNFCQFVLFHSDVSAWLECRGLYSLSWIFFLDLRYWQFIVLGTSLFIPSTFASIWVYYNVWFSLGALPGFANLTRTHTFSTVVVTWLLHFRSVVHWVIVIIIFSHLSLYLGLGEPIIDELMFFLLLDRTTFFCCILLSHQVCNWLVLIHLAQFYWFQLSGLACFMYFVIKFRFQSSPLYSKRTRELSYRDFALVCMLVLLLLEFWFI